MNLDRKRKAVSSAQPPHKRSRQEPPNPSPSTTRSSGPVTSSNCRLCEGARKKANICCGQETFFLSIDIPVSLLYKGIHTTQEGLSKEQRVQKKNLSEQFLERVCGLRNSGGGILLVHLVGLSNKDRYPGKLNEFTDDLLVKLINDGSAFADCFTKQWLDANQKLSKYYDFISITVRPKKQSVVTVNFMTKIPFDFKIENPQACHIQELLRTRKQIYDKKPQVRGRGREYRSLHESRDVQHKSFKADNYGKKKLRSLLKDIPSLGKHIWEDLRLPEYITSFSKLDRGGSYFFGISEEDCTYERKRYVSKKLVDDGLHLSVTKLEELKQYLLRKVQTDIFCCSYDGRKLNIDARDLVDIENHRTEDDKYVVEVAVGAVEGLVFYDAQGPRSFAIKEEELTRISFCEWFDTFTSQANTSSSDNKQ